MNAPSVGNYLLEIAALQDDIDMLRDALGDQRFQAWVNQLPLSTLLDNKAYGEAICQALEELQ